jgi:dTDP-glucose 4,6-dehydratase
MPKNVLLTGIGGFIGHHVAEWIMDHTDWDLIGLDSWNPLHKGDRLRISDKLQEHMRNGRLNLLSVDLTVEFSPQQKYLIEQYGDIDYVINMASDSHVTRSFHDPRQCWTNNTQLILNMLEYFREAGCEKFLQISTDEVYGDAGWEGKGHPEWDVIKPSNPYSASKAAQEALAISYWRTYELPVMITNTMNIIGERQDPEKFLPMSIARIDRGEKISIHSDSFDRIATRVWLDAKNKAAAVTYILENIEPWRYAGGLGDPLPSRYNIVGETEMDVLSLAQLTAKMMGKTLNYELVRGDEDRPGYDRRYALDGTKLAEAGFKPPFSFDETIQRVVDWTLKHPEWRK